MLETKGHENYGSTMPANRVINTEKPTKAGSCWILLRQESTTEAVKAFVFRIRRLSPDFEAMFGVPSGSLKGRTLNALSGPATRIGELIRCVRKAVEAGEASARDGDFSHKCLATLYTGQGQPLTLCVDAVAAEGGGARHCLLTLRQSGCISEKLAEVDDGRIKWLLTNRRPNRIVSVSRQVLSEFRVTDEQVVGRTMSLFFGPRTNAEVWQSCIQGASTGTVSEATIWLQRPADGADILSRIVCFPVERDGGVRNTMCVIQASQTLPPRPPSGLALTTLSGNARRRGSLRRAAVLTRWSQNQEARYNECVDEAWGVLATSLRSTPLGAHSPAISAKSEGRATSLPGRGSGASPAPGVEGWAGEEGEEDGDIDDDNVSASSASSQAPSPPTSPPASLDSSRTDPPSDNQAEAAPPPPQTELPIEPQAQPATQGVSAGDEAVVEVQALVVEPAPMDDAPPGPAAHGPVRGGVGGWVGPEDKGPGRERRKEPKGGRGGRKRHSFVDSVCRACGLGEGQSRSMSPGALRGRCGGGGDLCIGGVGEDSSDAAAGVDILNCFSELML